MQGVPLPAWIWSQLQIHSRMEVLEEEEEAAADPSTHPHSASSPSAASTSSTGRAKTPSSASSTTAREEDDGEPSGRHFVQLADAQWYLRDPVLRLWIETSNPPSAARRVVPHAVHPLCCPSTDLHHFQSYHMRRLLKEFRLLRPLVLNADRPMDAACRRLVLALFSETVVAVRVALRRALSGAALLSPDQRELLTQLQGAVASLRAVVSVAAVAAAVAPPRASKRHRDE